MLLVRCTVLVTLLVLPVAGQAQDARGEVEGRTLTVTTWPPVAVTVDTGFRYLGTRTVNLYDVAEAEIHVFADVTPDSVVERLYWLQLEAVYPSSEHRYDYSSLPGRTRIGGYPFVYDTRAGPGYTIENSGREGDTATMLRILQDAGYRMPDDMMRLRMVTLDDARRRELLIIYAEDLTARGLSVRTVQTDPAERSRALAGLVERALAGLSIARR